MNKIENKNALSAMEEMDSNSVDLTVTSPPYNMGNTVKGKKYDDFNDEISDYKQFIRQTIYEINRVTEYFSFINIQPVNSIRRDVYDVFGTFKRDIKKVFVWTKTNPPRHISDGSFSCGYEYFFCFGGDTSTSDFEGYSFDYASDVIRTNVNSTNQNAEKHGAVMPLSVADFFVEKFSKEKMDTVFDPFMGTGTTACAAVKNGLDYKGFDVSEEYIEIAEKRIEKHISQEELF